MKNLALLVLITLIGFTSYMNARGVPSAKGEKGAHLTWSTGINASRLEQREAFHKWLAVQGRPAITLELDAANNGEAKKIIQGVSGVGNTLMDIYGGGLLSYYDQMGLLEDVTPYLEGGDTWKKNLPESIAQEATRDGRSLGVPANISLQLVFANSDRFAEAGLGAPPAQWNWESFGRLGRAYVVAMNAKNPKRRHYFANRLSLEVLKRSIGVSTFNETLTASALDRTEYETVLTQVLTWTKVDHLLPTRGEMDAMSVEGSDSMSGSWGADAYLFSTGQLALVESSRWQVVQFRLLKLTNLAVVEYPAHHFRNALVTARYVCLYKGASPQEKNRAREFFAFLRSEAYSRQIIADGDALPPNPAILKSSVFTDPAGHPEDRAMNAQWVAQLEQRALGPVVSPFLHHAMVNRLENNMMDELLNGRVTVAEARSRLAQRIDQEIARNLKVNPSLEGKYRAALAKQKTIDDLKAAGKAVPGELIDNHFLRRYLGQGAKL